MGAAQCASPLAHVALWLPEQPPPGVDHALGLQEQQQGGGGVHMGGGVHSRAANPARLRMRPRPPPQPACAPPSPCRRTLSTCTTTTATMARMTSSRSDRMQRSVMMPRAMSRSTCRAFFTEKWISSRSSITWGVGGGVGVHGRALGSGAGRQARKQGGGAHARTNTHTLAPSPAAASAPAASLLSGCRWPWCRSAPFQTAAARRQSP